MVNMSSCCLFNGINKKVLYDNNFLKSKVSEMIFNV